MEEIKRKKKTNLKYGSSIKCFEVKLPLSSSQILTRSIPNGFICNPVIKGNDIVIPVLYNPFMPDEDWYDTLFKVMRNDQEYELGSYEYIGTVSQDLIIYNIMRVL